MFRERWLVAIAELGRDAAFEDGAQAFAQRLGCTPDEGRAIVRRAWRMLGIEPLHDGGRISRPRHESRRALGQQLTATPVGGVRLPVIGLTRRGDLKTKLAAFTEGSESAPST